MIDTIVEVIMPTPVWRAVTEAVGNPEANALLRTVRSPWLPPAPVREERATAAEKLIAGKHMGTFPILDKVMFVKAQEYVPGTDYSNHEQRLIAILAQGKDGYMRRFVEQSIAHEHMTGRP